MLIFLKLAFFIALLVPASYIYGQNLNDHELLSKIVANIVKTTNAIDTVNEDFTSKEVLIRMEIYNFLACKDFRKTVITCTPSAEFSEQWDSSISSTYTSAGYNFHADFFLKIPVSRNNWDIDAEFPHDWRRWPRKPSIQDRRCEMTFKKIHTDKKFATSVIFHHKKESDRSCAAEIGRIQVKISNPFDVPRH